MAWAEHPPPPPLPMSPPLHHVPPSKETNSSSSSYTSRFQSLSLSVPRNLNAHIQPPPPQHPPPPYHHHPPYSAMPPPPIPHASARKRKYFGVRHGDDERDGSQSPARESSASSGSFNPGDSEYDPSRAGRSSTRGGGASASGANARSKRPAAQSKPAAAVPTSAPSSSSTPAKVGPNGRPMSREQLRKANHSLIERRRREKINAALAELRAMVPGLCDDSGKGGEFKLEVLERTVEHMHELKQQVVELESRLSRGKRRRSTTEDQQMDVDDEDEQPAERPTRRLLKNHSPASNKASSTSTPPSPSITPPSARHTTILSPDPNETEAETDLPPPLTVASRHHHSDNTTDSSTYTGSPHPPSIASLLHSSSATEPQHHLQPPQQRSSMPAPPRSNPGPSPGIYLPFPTPSPTSPFLTYHGSAASTASSATGPPEPSPFMAPLPNISLFAGALDTPLDGPDKRHSPPDLTMPLSAHTRERGDRGDLAPEEAANLLLAFSSPDTLRPSKTGSTPLMSAVHVGGARERRLTLESEEFTLDGGVASYNKGHSGSHSKGAPRTQGKTARDILRM